MLPVKPKLDLNKNLIFDVDGETFTAEDDARHFAASTDAINVLINLVSVFKQPATKENLESRLTSIVNHAKEIIAFVQGSLITDFESLNQIRDLYKAYTRGLVSLSEFNAALEKLV